MAGKGGYREKKANEKLRERSARWQKEGDEETNDSLPDKKAETFSEMAVE